MLRNYLVTKTQAATFRPSNTRPSKVPLSDTRPFTTRFSRVMLPKASTFHNALAGASASLFGMTLLAGGLRVIVDPTIRPPRLPNRRPPRWMLPTVGTAWLAAGCGISVHAISGQKSSAQQQDTPHGLISRHFLTRTVPSVVLTGLAVPGLAQVAFELTRLTIASRRPNPTQAVVVLGCALKGNEPSEILERRLKAAERVIERSDSNSETLVICSGGVGNDAHTDSTRAEGEVMVQWLAKGRDQGTRAVSASTASVTLVAENEARNTVENIEYSRKLIPEGFSVVTVVTSDFHVIRVLRLLHEAGLGHWRVVGAYTPVKYWATSTLREFLAQFVLWTSLIRK